MSAPHILSYGVALPSLRLPASAYRAAWGSCAASGLQQKAFCAYDEDPITLAASAVQAAFARLGTSAEAHGFDALFVGSTTLPYEEKPSSATLLTCLSGNRAVRVSEIRGSTQAGLQALAAAQDYCAAHPGKTALAVATDAPAAPIDAPYEHATAAGAAAFVVGPAQAGGIARITGDGAVSLDTLGDRFRRRGEAAFSDLELRTRTEADGIKALAHSGLGQGAIHLACGLSPRSASAAAKAFGSKGVDGIFPQLGDAGAASAALALADVFDRADAGETVVALAASAGAFGLTLETLPGVNSRNAAVLTVAQSLSRGRVVDYMAYVRHRRMLSTRNGETG
jgi:hydroxymethylglutaryl-CoA synthase